jgi:hypothetical protein
MIDLRVLLFVVLAPLAGACGGTVSDTSGGGAGSGDSGLTCNESCPGAVAAACAHGPPSEADCLNGCEVVQATCADAYDALSTCAGASPTYACGADGQVQIVGCESQGAALDACISGM